MTQVHDSRTVDFIAKKHIYNESLDFLQLLTPLPDPNYTGHLKDFLQNINKNKSKMESMDDNFVPIFLITLAICLLIICVILLVLRKVPVYLSLVAGSVLCLVLNMCVEAKKRGEISTVSQDIKVQAELLKVKTKGQFEIMIITPVPKGCFIFSMHRYIIRLIFKYQDLNDNKQINLYTEKDPFSFTPESNNMQRTSTPAMPGQSGMYNIPMHEVNLYQGDTDYEKKKFQADVDYDAKAKV